MIKNYSKLQPLQDLELKHIESNLRKKKGRQTLEIKRDPTRKLKISDRLEKLKTTQRKELSSLEH